MERWKNLKVWERKLFPVLIFFCIVAVFAEYMQTTVTGPRWIRWYLGDFTYPMAYSVLVWMIVGWRISYGLLLGFIAGFFGEILIQPFFFNSKIDVADAVIFLISTILIFLLGYYFHKKTNSREKFFW